MTQENTYTTYAGQNIVDLALQLYGDPLAFFILLEDNPHLSLEAEIPAGTQIRYDERKKNRPLVEYYKSRPGGAIFIKTGTGD